MKLRYSLRVKLTILFLIALVLPILLIMFALPTYYRNLLGDETRTLTEGLLTSLTRNIETYLDDLDRLTIAPYLYEDVMRALKIKVSGQYAEADDYTKLRANRALNTTLPQFLQNPRKDILATILLPLDGSVIVSSWSNIDTVWGYPFAEQRWYQQAVRAGGNVAFISAHPQDYFPSSQRKQVFSVARLIKDTDSWKPLAVIMADADTVVLSKITADLKFNVNSVVCILDSDHQLLFSSQPVSEQLLAQIARQAPVLEDAQDSYVSVSRTILSAQWTVVVLLSNSEMNARVRWLYLAGFLFALGGLFLTYSLFYTLSRSIVNPFQQMMTVMKKVQRGDMESRFISHGKDEIAELGGALNNMIAQLGELIEREYKAAINQRNAEYMALQSQIQPHFLYNTLNSFIALNRMGERASLEKAIYSLSNMLRYTLGPGDWATVEDEFQFLQRYCDLQRLRFQERLTVDVHYQSEVSRLRIPKLLLQPLIENALIHGIEPLARPCRLVVRARLDQDEGQPTLEMSVHDDGAGFNLQDTGSKGCIGLANVRERLKMAHPASSFSMTSTIDAGTEIRIAIPVDDGVPSLLDMEAADESSYR